MGENPPIKKHEKFRHNTETKYPIRNRLKVKKRIEKHSNEEHVSVFPDIEKQKLERRKIAQYQPAYGTYQNHSPTITKLSTNVTRPTFLRGYRRVRIPTRTLTKFSTFVNTPSLQLHHGSLRKRPPKRTIYRNKL